MFRFANQFVVRMKLKAKITITTKKTILLSICRISINSKNEVVSAFATQCSFENLVLVDCAKRTFLHRRKKATTTRKDSKETEKPQRKRN